MPRRNKRAKTPAERREELLARTGAGVCNICWEGIYPWQTINWDHIVPMSKGGSKGRINKALTHEVCNSVKGDSVNFHLRTEAERSLTKAAVKPAVWARLVRAWAGCPDE